MCATNEQLESVQRKVAQGDYTVDCQRVAAAMLERIEARVTNGSDFNPHDGGHVLLEALSDLRAV